MQWRWGGPDEKLTLFLSPPKRILLSLQESIATDKNIACGLQYLSKTDSLQIGCSTGVYARVYEKGVYDSVYVGAHYQVWLANQPCSASCHLSARLI